MTPKRRTKRYKVKVFTKSRNPIALMYSGGNRSFYLDAHGQGLSKTEALKAMRNMKTIYPGSFQYRIRRMKR